MKNIKRVVAKLTWDRKDGLVELEKVKSELKARDDDVKVAVEAKDKVVAELQHLVGQIEGTKAIAILEFRAFEAFDDINTRYFLSGFEAFRKQVGKLPNTSLIWISQSSNLMMMRTRWWMEARAIRLDDDDTTSK